jgi:hypothetical protein
MPEEGYVRVRIGDLIAQSSQEELGRLGLKRGSIARACFTPGQARLIALTAE